MSYPKWKYRKHPALGIFQSTLVLNETAESELGSDWSDDPTSTGFQVKPATQLHPSHIVEDLPLHTVVTDVIGNPLEAFVELVTQGDKNG